MVKKILRNKRAFIHIIEAFIAITLVMVIVPFLIQENLTQKRDVSGQIYSNELGLLKKMQVNETYRNYILASPFPIYWTNESFPDEIKTLIENEKPFYLECRAKICNISSFPCFIEEKIEKDVYAQAIFVSSNSTFYSPRQLKLFCWEK